MPVSKTLSLYWMPVYFSSLCNFIDTSSLKCQLLDLDHVNVLQCNGFYSTQILQKCLKSAR